MLLKYTTIDRIFQFVSKIKPNGFNENDIIGWIGEALDFMSTPKQFEEAVCYVEVSNYQAIIPTWTHNIIQIVRDNNYVYVAPNTLCNTTSTTTATVDEDGLAIPLLPCQFFPDGEGNPVVVNQLGQPITDYELAYYRPYFDLQYDYLNWASNFVGGRFSPVRLATNHYFNSLVCPEQAEIYTSCTDEYSIIKGEILRFSFESGGVLIAYLRQITNDGYPMIPDEVSCITAIQHYIRMKFATEDFYAHREGSDSRLQKSEADWHWYCKQFSSKMMMPSTVDEWQNLLEGRNYLIPRDNYYGYFGHFNKAEQRNFFKT